MGRSGLDPLEGGALSWTTTLAEAPECNILQKDVSMEIRKASTVLGPT